MGSLEGPFAYDIIFVIRKISEELVSLVDNPFVTIFFAEICKGDRIDKVACNPLTDF
jgi:hypothetical protein